MYLIGQFDSNFELCFDYYVNFVIPAKRLRVLGKIVALVSLAEHRQKHQLISSSQK